MSDKPIFAIERLTKSYQNKKPVLKDISLVFLENAKIGVIGQNGAGKSTLLKIMAGVDKEFDGVARLAEGKTVGYVPQEPLLFSRTLFENVAFGRPDASRDEVREVLRDPENFKSTWAMLIPFVVSDRNLVTSRWPFDAKAYSMKLAAVIANTFRRQENPDAMPIRSGS
jgi:ATPase subunit of ABC transporter with duplicated ATPase domains